MQRRHRSHGNNAGFQTDGFLDFLIGGVHVTFMRGDEGSARGRTRDTSGLNKGSETRDKGGVSSEALACFHQQNCNHTV